MSEPPTQMRSAPAGRPALYIRMDPDLAECVEAMKRHKGLSGNDVGRLALRRYFGIDEVTPWERRR